MEKEDLTRIWQEFKNLQTKESKQTALAGSLAAFGFRPGCSRRAGTARPIGHRSNAPIGKLDIEPLDQDDVTDRQTGQHAR